MSKYYGKTNVITKGGAELNISYGLTPPQDTSKLWLRTDSKPSEILINNEEKMIIDNEIVTTVNDDLYIYSNSYSGTNAIKIGNYIYMGQISGSSSGINPYSYGSKRISRLNITNGVIDFIIGSGSDRQYYLLGKKDNHSFYYATYYYNDSPRWQLYEYDVTTGNNVRLQVENFEPNFYYLQKSGNYVYWFTDSTNLILKRWNMINFEIETFNIIMPTGATSISYDNNRVIIDGKVYFANTETLKTTVDGTYYCYKRRSRVYVYDIATNECLFTGKEFYKDHSYTSSTQGVGYVECSCACSGGSLVIIDGNIKMYGGSGEYIYYSYSGGGAYGFGTNYWYRGTIYCLDDETKEIYLIGGSSYTSETFGYNTTFNNNVYFKKYSYTFELEKDTLLLSGYAGQGNKVTLISTDTITLMQEIDYAYLGNNNNQAQYIEMYQYEGSAWYGVNCINWNEILSASISVNNNVLEMNTEETNTQEYTYNISSVAHDNDPIYRIEANVDNENVCTASVNTTAQTISITTTDNIGITNVRLQLIDNYNNIFEATIEVSSLGFTYLANITEVQSNTTLSDSIECNIGDLIIASVIARDNGNETVNTGWTLLGRSQTGGGNSQTLAFYYKIAEATTESITVTQSSSNRIYISMVAFNGKTTATLGSFTFDSSVDRKTITLPTNSVCLVSSSADLWTTNSPYPLWEYNGTNSCISILMPTTTQGRLGTWIDYGNEENRTIICPTTPNTLITGYVIIE